MLNAAVGVDCASKDTRDTLDQPTRQQQIEQNTALALALSHRFRHRNLDREDLEQIAYLALIQAVDSFDPTRGSTLGGYLRRCIRRALRKAVRRADLIARPCNGSGQPQEVMSIDQMTEEGDSEGAWDVADPRPGPDAEPVSEDGFRRLVDRLPRREWEVMVLLYGENMTQEQVAATLRITQGRVAQLRDAGLAKLRRLVGVEATEPDDKPCEAEDVA